MNEYSGTKGKRQLLRCGPSYTFLDDGRDKKENLFHGDLKNAGKR